MRVDHQSRNGRWLLGCAHLAFLALFLTVPTASHGQETPSSYDQIAPVLLGKESFEAVMSQGQGRQGGGHGSPEEALGGALRSRFAARRQS